MQDAAARQGSPSRPGAVCPSCGKEIDPLRAGQVSIEGGRFVYFCDQACKLAHTGSRSRPSCEILTADPPPVEMRQESPSGEGATSGERVRTNDTAKDVAEVDETEPPADEELAEEAGPETLRSPAVVREGSDLEPSAAQPFASMSDVTTFLGIAAGVLAWAVTLVGAAEKVRLPLATLSLTVLLIRGASVKRDPSHPHPLVALAPPCGALVAAGWALAIHSPHASTLASFAGLAAASGLLIAHLLEKTLAAVRSGRERICEALDVQVRVVRGEETALLPAAQVKAGEQVVIEVGEVVGVDGVVLAGEATVIPWLDASIELAKREGDAVVAGAKIVTGRLRLTTTRAAQDRAWIRLSISPTQRMDVAAPLARSTRVVIERGAPVAALLAGLVAYATNSSPVEVLGVVSATGLAVGAWGVGAVIALHHARGQSSALAHGIVFKDANAFNDAGTTDVAVLCSRGTVLMGDPEIVALEPLASLDVERILSLAAGAETASTHPFAAAIMRAARNRGIRPENVRNAKSHAGLGVTALSSTGERLVVGSRALLLQEGVSVALADARASTLEAEGRSVLLAALGGKLVGLVALQDGLRAGARASVQRLLDARIEPVLLSGEARDTCETIGRALDIDHIRPEILPADRGAAVRALGEGGHVVAVLGHPDSDDAALAAADVSVAMLAAGGSPGEWSVALASDEVKDAALALALARGTRDKARVALAIGLFPSALAALAVTLGVAPPSLAPATALLGAMAALAHARAS